MTLAQQFPDISAAIRSKKEAVSKKPESTNGLPSFGNTEADAVARYYEGEFRRWHLKFLFIVAGTIGLFCLILVKLSWVYNLITIG